LRKAERNEFLKISKKNIENTGVAGVMNTGPAMGQSQKPQPQGRFYSDFPCKEVFLEKPTKYQTMALCPSANASSRVVGCDYVCVKMDIVPLCTVHYNLLKCVYIK
jgi:hypothetical protein